MTALTDFIGDAAPVCRSCACSDFSACDGGCWWVQDPEGGDLCSACVDGPDEPAEGGGAGA